MTRSVRLIIRNPSEADREVRDIVASMLPGFEPGRYGRAFADVERLFHGSMEGYHHCDTGYHDFAHTLGVLLATARLLHGVHLVRHGMSPRTVELALIAALFHDTGYIRREEERIGTGARFAVGHVERSIDLLESYADARNWPVADMLDMESMIRCTELAASPLAVVHANIEVMLAAHVLATADIIAQMADDIYLEKLDLLFDEFVEAGITEFGSRFELAASTRGFHAFMRARMENCLSNAIGCMSAHFKARFGVERDPYTEAARRNMLYLGLILDEHGREYRKGLRRSLSRRQEPVRVAA
ncbi:HD domain-containing protein [Pseudodesulfovibrio sp. F-1]|uniref:HD domain-containing protein n=1 Tax=Pseudodesulfovibrio alkaliphilus TaxID=2661613 RepID=A0A7K1KJA8_9BACT|nr:HD domain-containing protein [Pseudodesulfovibrio alkaliphilus]MUM76100.1 HD domain-containing protein [Pseudodesulfovibrio alkaliphilus]